MKIALVAPSPVPFLIGGAENLWTGWLAALNAQPGVEADLIKLPTPERNFWEIVDSYQRWAELDVSHFDRVISTKYPAWMVAHDDHHVFLQHKLRGLYDTWPQRLETQVRCDARVVRDVLAVLDHAGTDRAALPDIFGALARLRAEAAELPRAIFGLPGALIRRVVHGLDAIGLARTQIRRYAAISETVRQRAGYFPPGAQVEVMHHPTLLRPHAHRTGKVPAGAIFTASRLDGPKRLHWLIDAYRLAVQRGVTAPLVIAGDGPQREQLAARCRDLPGVHLVGRLTDAELAAAYEDALFVPFVPDREDYGLITLEALQAGRPVLTCSDAGGVTELVRDGENGLVTRPDVTALAEGMCRLCLDDSLRQSLAGRARASVAHIDWPQLAAAFSRPWPRLVVVNTFPIHPANNGGKIRMQSLYRRLTRYANVTVVNLGPHGQPLVSRRLQAGLTEVVVPMSAAHAAFDALLSRRLKASCTDVAAMLKPQLSPQWLKEIERACADADAVIACHPYGWPAIRKVWQGPVVYESLNVEADLKAAIFGHDGDAVSEVARVERGCAQDAALVLCCSAEDAARMQQLHGLQQRPHVVANGVDVASYPVLTHAERAALRRRLGLPEDMALAVFVGSLHGPNIDSLQLLYGWAATCPQVLFAVVGSVCEAQDLPDARAENVLLVGRVSDAQLRAWLAVADVGLNPMVSGSGTNLKMLEYAAAGVPILSTPFGGRGGILQPQQHYVAAEIDDFPAALRGLLSEDAQVRAERAQAARARAAQAGDWQVIADAMWQAMCDAAVVGKGTPPLE